MTPQQWLKRAVTIVVVAPLVIVALRSERTLFVFVQFLHMACLYEHLSNICPPLRARAARTDKLCCRLDAEGMHLMVIGAVMAVSARFGYAPLALATWVGFVSLCVLHLVKLNCTGEGQTASASHYIASLVSLCLDIYGMGFISLGFSAIAVLRSGRHYPYGYSMLLTLCTWNTDNGGIVFGSLVPERFRTRAFPIISPGKTHAGLLGGFCLSVATALAMWGGQQRGLFGEGFLPQCSVRFYLLTGACIGLSSILGDLIESFLKRTAGVKDSGVFFPGHGGCLDRMDSFLFSAPLMCVLAELAAAGHLSWFL